VDHELLLSHAHRDTLGGVLPPTCLPPDHPPAEAGGAQGGLLPPQREPGNSPPPPLVPLTLSASGARLLAGVNQRPVVRLPSPTLEDTPPSPADEEPPPGGRGSPPNDTLHPWAVQDAHDQLPPCVPGARPPAPVPDGQHILRPEEKDERGAPRRMVLPFPDPRVLPTPPGAAAKAFYGFGQVRCRENSPDESWEKLPGRPSNLEVPRCRHLLPPLRLGTRDLRARYPLLPLETAQQVTPPPRRN